MTMNRTESGIGFVVALAVVGLALSASADVTLTKIGEYDISVNGCGGITYLGDDQYYVVRDHNDNNVAELYPLTITSNPSTGAISYFDFGSPVSLIGNGDTEGIAYDPATGYIWVSDESTPTIKEYLPSMGTYTDRAVTLPTIQRTQKRGNKSLEALTISGDGLTMWSSNEEALQCDGDIASASAGTTVRLMKFTRPTVRDVFTHAGEWAYTTKKCAGSTYAQNGVPGLCALPDGSLLVLERETSTSTYGRCEVYRVPESEFTVAKDISSVTALTNANYSVVNKGSPLISFSSNDMSNMIIYEGICLGPRLNDGSQAVYLISDGGVSKTVFLFTAYTVSRLCALKLSGLDVHTVNFTTPAQGTSSIVGSNYRYLNGATVNVALEGVQTPPTAYTNNNATLTDVTWTASGQSPTSGSGAVATFSVAGDGTFAWAWSQSAAVSSVLANDSFEAYAAGTQGSDIPGWSGEDAEVVETNYSTAAGYPMANEAHTKVLKVDGDLTRTYPAVETNAPQRLDFMVAVRRAPSNEEMAGPEGGNKLVVACNSNGNMCAYCKVSGSTTNWVVLSNTQYANDDWVRVTLTFDYTSNNGGRAFAQVKLDGTECSTASGYASPTDLTRGGSWYELLEVGSNRCVSSLVASGMCKLDDIILTIEPKSASEVTFADDGATSLLENATAANAATIATYINGLTDSTVVKPVTVVTKPMVVSYLLRANKVLSTSETELLKITKIEQVDDDWQITVSVTLNAADTAAGAVVNLNQINGALKVSATDDLGKSFAPVDASKFTVNASTVNPLDAVVTVTDEDAKFLKATITE